MWRAASSPPTRARHENVIVWFRPETIQTVKWGGNPDEKPTVTGPHGPRLTPRKSFELFVESVQQRALPWKSVEIEAALRLRLLIMELVVTRADQLSQMNADLMRSNEELDAFAYVASHDLKEPLRGISKYAHQLLESAAALDGENRKRLEGLMRLTLRMDSLLDSLLHFSRVGRPALDLQTVDLNEIVQEALEIVAARRQETPTDIVIPRPLPSISCDRTRVREVFTNLIGNALKYNDKPCRRVEIGFLVPGSQAIWPTRRRSAWRKRSSMCATMASASSAGTSTRSLKFSNGSTVAMNMGVAPAPGWLSCENSSRSTTAVSG